MTRIDLSTPRSRILLKTIQLASLPLLADDPLMCGAPSSPRAVRLSVHPSERIRPPSRAAKPSVPPSGQLAARRDSQIDNTVALSPRPLHLAALYCRPEAVVLLARHGGDPNGRDGRGLQTAPLRDLRAGGGRARSRPEPTPTLPASTGSPHCMSPWTSRSPRSFSIAARPLEATDQCGNTPLHTAEWHAAVRTPVLRVSAGGGGTGSDHLDRVIDNVDGRLQRAQERVIATVLPNLDVAAFLKKRGADTSRRNGAATCRTSLHRAVKEQLVSWDPD